MKFEYTEEESLAWAEKRAKELGYDDAQWQAHAWEEFDLTEAEERATDPWYIQTEDYDVVSMVVGCGGPLRLEVRKAVGDATLGTAIWDPSEATYGASTTIACDPVAPITRYDFDVRDTQWVRINWQSDSKVFCRGVKVRARASTTAAPESRQQ